jgi:zinc transport system substrate-binding protein
MKTKIFLRITLFAILLGGFVGCKKRDIKVENCAVVSIAPLKPIVQEILGDDFEVVVLVPQGASPETFEPTAKQLQKVEKARFVFGTGLLEFEQELLNRITRKEQVINLSQGIETIGGCCSHSHHHGHSHGVDPHIWCSPKSLMKMAENMHSAIHQEMPDSTKYTERYNALNAKLLELDREVADMCKNGTHKQFLIYHPALTYLARDYGLKQVAIEKDGKEPSIAYLNSIIRDARKEGVKHIFYQSEFPASSVETICDEIGAKAEEINPLAENIIEEIHRITTLITE